MPGDGRRETSVERIRREISGRRIPPLVQRTLIPYLKVKA